MARRRSSHCFKWISGILAAVMVAAFLPSVAQAGFTVPITEYGVMPSPEFIILGNDGNMWFTNTSSPSGGYIGKLTTTGVLTSYNTNQAPWHIANGPDEGGDHYIWWTESYFGNEAIGKINVSTGTITHYTLLDDSSVSGITLGPDGAMWFTYGNRNKIGRITTAGVITEYDAPSFAIVDITLGPDGNLWFTDWSNDAIGKITVSPTVTMTEYTFAAPPGSSPTCITTGPDGNLWFTFANGFNGVGRITIAGVVTLFSGLHGIGITTGPDGNLWVADVATSTLSRYTPQGKVTYYDIPTAGAYPTGIAAGPDGNIWFTEADADKVGKLVPQYAYPSVGSTTISSLMNPGPTQFTIMFDQAVVDPGGDTAPEDVTNVENYLLVNLGANKMLDTVSCDGGVVQDDGRVVVDNVLYDPDFRTATIYFNGGSPLPKGNYALFVCGTTSITNTVGNPLGGGADFLARFSVGAFAGIIPNTGFAPGVKTILPLQPLSKTYDNLGDLWLEIPSHDVKLPIVAVPATREGWDVTWLGDQAGWLQGTAFPTWAGNSVITGHVWNADNTPGPFVYLNRLSWGDVIIVHAWGQEYVYNVRSVKRVLPDDTASMMKHETLPWLTLVTCQGYDSKTGLYRFRVEVKAVQVLIKE